MPDKEYSEEDIKNMSAEEIAELQKQNCIFCKIASKEIPAKIIHEDSDVMCILDINPASEGHILVYPKKHYMIMPHVPDDVLSKVFKDVKLMSHTLLKTLQCKGTTIFIANGAAAGQRAPHVLVHVFPRRENDGLVKLPKYEMNDEQIEKLKKELAPYMNPVFGGRRHPKREVKEAEFEEKKEEPKITDRITEEQKIERKGPDKETKHKSKEEPAEKKAKGGDTNGKVDLDDIAKLFG